ncbi:hydroxyacylglutathione hydrolase, mitochondrial isoform X2 [Tetranychus urticae]|uniref:hydroxyacylglutathione hydrolase, mitochondrial isoform X2 n=1 Tax=Tetranychus urticae TaxID=32264 RepID=UPI00077C0473|nr:hydroxyacylglutathione hydrolase, mitochondrial isoform X2 [Tetranychus urticae]
MLQRLIYFTVKSIRNLTGTHSTHSLTVSGKTMDVKILSALSDNYMYLIIDKDSKKAAIVDPVEPDKVLQSVSEAGVELTTVLTTHHHWDHSGGNAELVSKAPGLTVCGFDDRIGALTKKVNHGDTFSIGKLKINCLYTPCHTSGHICYHVVPPSGESDGAVFTGDTLFQAGCGKFFEGTPDQMYDALINKLGSLPDSTKVYCGHEYTVSNLVFAQSTEPSNKDIQDRLNWAKVRRSLSETTIPSTIAMEKLINPFMRVKEPSIQKYAGSTNPVEIMGILRNAKNNFKA